MSVRLAQEVLGGSPDFDGRNACLTADPELFYPPAGPDEAIYETAAKQVCFGCEVRRECLTDALDRGERFGIWGGLNPKERKQLAKKAAA